MTHQNEVEPWVGLVIEKPEAMRKRVHDFLHGAILSGRIVSGTRLVETTLAQSMGVSRTPVREALHSLEREGLVVSAPRVGYQVRAIEWAEIEMICEIRIVNEVLAAQWATERLTDHELEALEVNLSECEAELARGNADLLAEHDAAFHEILARASGSERLFEICQNLRRHVVLFRVESFRDLETARLATRGHRRILERLKARDKDGVAEAVRAHLEDAKAFIAGHISEDHREDDR
ncbi:MAG: GntR family transcriptional regulator [Thermoleophilia bacterium]|nr:GntR family transcriptional regulator [Thermoleophilia bacterium]